MHDLKGTTPSPTATAPEVPQVETLTDWSQLARAGFVPTEIICTEDPYKVKAVSACHSRLLTKRVIKGAAINPKTKRQFRTGSSHAMIEHTKKGHGGLFKLTLRKETDPARKAWPGWDELRAASIECGSFYCAWCDKQEPSLNGNSILAHMTKQHKGNGRGMRSSQEFWIQLVLPPVPGEDEEDIED